MRTPTVKLLKRKNYLAMVRNAAKGENHMFRNLHALVDGQEVDIVDNGALACSFFLSGVLYLNKLIADMHANMAGLEKDMGVSGWKEMDTDPKEGDVIVWEPRAPAKERPFDPTQLHAGVYLGGERAVSNGSSSTRMPEEHHYTFDGTRAIIRVWRHPGLEE